MSEGEGGHIWTMQEKLERRRADLNEPGADEEPTDEAPMDPMDYVRSCLAVIEGTRTRKELADWWDSGRDMRRQLGITKNQLDGLKAAVAKKRDSLPGGRTDQPYATMDAG